MPNVDSEPRAKQDWLTRVMLAFMLLGAVVIYFLSRPGFIIAPSEEMEHGGEHRFYDVRLPPNADPSLPAPLLLVLHGGGESASRMERISGLTELAGRAGYIISYPEGVEGFWNDGRAGEYSRASRSNVDDVGFLSSVVDAIAAKHPVDRSRLYVIGFGNGGMMALRWACEQGDALAGVVAISASLPAEFQSACTNQMGVPLMLVFGTDDPLLPYQGGDVIMFGQFRGELLGARATTDFWAIGNQCETDPVTTLLPDIDPTDGTSTERLDYTNCAGGEVRLYSVRGGGHMIPGVRQDHVEHMFGIASRDFHALEEGLAFLESSQKESPP